MMSKKLFITIASALVFAAASFFVWFLDRGFAGQLENWQKYAGPAAMATVLGVVFALGWLFSESRKKALLFSFLAASPFAVLALFDPWALLAGLAAGFCFWLAWRRGANEKKASFKIFTFKIFQAGLPIFFTGLAVMVSFVYLLNNLEEVKAGNFEVLGNSESLAGLGDAVFKIISGPEARNLSLSMTVDDFLLRLLVSQGQLDEAVLENPTLRREFQAQLDRAKEELNQKYGLRVRGDESVVSVLQLFINEKIKASFGPYQKFLPLVFALAMFLALRAIGFLYVWLVAFLGWSFYKILLGTGIAVKAVETAEKENVFIR